MPVHPYAKVALTDALAETSHHLARVGVAFYPMVQAAERVGDSETGEFIAEVTSKVAFFFIDLITQFAADDNCIIFGGMPEWSQSYLSSHGYGWDDAKKRRYNFLMQEYRRAVETCTDGANPFEQPIAIFGDDDFKELFRRASNEDRATGPDDQDLEGSDEEADGGLGLGGAAGD